MDPQNFVKVTISKLALRLPLAAKVSSSRVHSTCSPCFCKINVPNNQTKTVPLPLHPQNPQTPSNSGSQRTVNTFYLDENAFLEQGTPSCGGKRRENPCLEIRVYTGKGGGCGSGNDKKLGKVKIPLDCKWMNENVVEVQNGWVSIGKHKAGELHLTVKAELDPRYIFQFDGQPEESPLILQSQGKVYQPIFSCKFSRDRESRFRSDQPKPGHAWMSEKNKDRKGWLILIHDLSGSPVAAASMVTPFVPSSGTDHVCRSNPGAWLILMPSMQGANSWLPLGHLEAWREHAKKDEISCKFKSIDDTSRNHESSNTILLSRTVIKCHEISKDNVKIHIELPIPGGFVMSATTFHDRNNRNGKRNKLHVQLAMRHVKCLTDAAIFMALAAAMDLSVVACRPFSRSLTRELGCSCALL